MNYLGDILEDQTVHFKWNSNDISGASITRATDGTIYVYKDDATGTEVTTGVTDTEDHDSLTGVHHCKIVTTDAFYATGADYFVVLKAATIDGQTVNACLAHFSIENRSNLSAAEVNAECDTALADYDPPTKAEMDSGFAGLNDPTSASIADAVWDELSTGHTDAGKAGAQLWTDIDAILTDTDELQTDDVPGLIGALNDLSQAEANAACDSAIETYQLDHLLAADYDPASKPGVATALLNELIESDGGVARFTANALEEAPGGGGSTPQVLIDTTIAAVTDQTHFTLTAGSNVDNAYKDQTIVLYDASNSDYPSIRTVSAYEGASKTITLDEAPDFTIISGDGIKVFVATTTVLTGDGDNLVTLTIEEVDTTPIPDVKISIMNSDSTVLLATGISDSNGDASFSLDDGTYKVLLRRIGWTFTVPETLVVDESPETDTYNGTEISVGDPPVADVCRMYEYCVDQVGDPLASITCWAAITDRPYDDGEGMFETQEVVGTYDSGTGLVYWDIVRGATVTIKIDEIGLYKKYTVPDQATARLGDLTPLPS